MAFQTEFGHTLSLTVSQKPESDLKSSKGDEQALLAKVS